MAAGSTSRTTATRLSLPADTLPSSVIQFPASMIAARECADDPTTQLIESLFAGYQIAVGAYQRAPTSARWRELKQSFACWHTAFLAEYGDAVP